MGWVGKTTHRVLLRKKTGVEIKVDEELIRSCGPKQASRHPPRVLLGSRFARRPPFLVSTGANPGPGGEPERRDRKVLVCSMCQSTWRKSTHNGYFQAVSCGVPDGGVGAGWRIQLWQVW